MSDIMLAELLATVERLEARCKRQARKIQGLRKHNRELRRAVEWYYKGRERGAQHEMVNAANNKLAIALQTIAAQKEALAYAERIYRVEYPGAK